MADKKSIYNAFIEKQNQLNQEKLQIWMDYTLFSWRWWLGILIIVLFVCFWITRVD